MATTLRRDADRGERATPRPEAAADPSWRRLYSVGAVATGLFIILTVASTVVLPLTSFPGGNATLPDATSTLRFISGNRTAFIVDEILFQVPYMFTIVTFMALYAALKRVDGTWAAIGAVLSIGSIIASLNYLTLSFGLVHLSDQFTAASSDAQRAGLVSAAGALLAQYNVPSLTAIVWPAGVLLISIAMLKGIFHRGVAYIGIATGAAGITGEATHAVIGNLYAIYGILLLVWVVIVGWKLFVLGRHPASTSLK